MLPREIEEIKGADELDPGDLEQVHGEQRREDAERERAGNAVAERLALLLARQPEHEDRQDERVVGAEEPLEHDEQADRQEIREMDVHSGCRAPRWP